jgi:DNA replication and repair protein RecF
LLTKGQKKIKVNGSLVKGYPLGWPAVVLFTPDDLGIIKGSPQSRRRFIDTEIGPIDNKYNYNLSRYQRILFQRNNLLKDLRKGNNNNTSLHIWNEQFSKYGAKIISLRLSLLKKVNDILAEIYGDLTGGAEQISFRYGSALKIDRSHSEQEIQKNIEEFLITSEKEEIKRGQSLVGPHRDDLIFLINGREARIYGSQGQQRTLILALKLTLLQVWYNETEEYPILLLDDVLSELDQARQKYLLKKIGNNVQTFITTSIFADINQGSELAKKSFTIKAGKII